MTNRWRKSLLHPAAHLRGSTPDLLAPGDPWAGDEIEMQPGRYENYVRFSSARPVLDQAGHDAVDADFRRLYRQLLDGEAPEPVVSLVELNTSIPLINKAPAGAFIELLPADIVPSCTNLSASIGTS